MGITLSKLKLPKVITDKKLAAIEAIGALALSKKDQILQYARAPYAIGVTLGASGAGKSELLCVFNEAAAHLEEKDDTAWSSQDHAPRSGPEIRKVFKIPLSPSTAAYGKLMISDGSGAIETIDIRFRQIEKYVEDELSSNKPTGTDGDKIPFVCFIMVNLADDLAAQRMQYAMQAEWRLFKRRILDRTYGKAKLRLLPTLIVVGTHLDEITKETDDENRGLVDAKVTALNEIIRTVAEKEGIAMHYRYRTLVADFYTGIGRKEFIGKVCDDIFPKMQG